MADKLTVTYDGSNIVTEAEISGNATVTYDGNAIATISAGQTKVLNCAGKVMATDVVVGGKTLNCAGRYMATNVFIAVEKGTNNVAVLNVKKITATTYDGTNSYTGENFILLTIYPVGNSTVSVTFDGVTKTINEIGNVFFGTYNGVSDGTTASSGVLTISGDYEAYGIGVYKKDSKNTEAYASDCIVSISDWGNPSYIPVEAFYECKGFTELNNLPNTITEIKATAFYNNSNVTSLVIPEKVNKIHSVFNDIASPTNPKGTFESCSKLSSIIIHGSMTHLGTWAFHNCVALVSVDFQANCENMTLCLGAFEGCSNLKSINLPAGLKSFNYRDGFTVAGSAFSGCYNLVNINIPSENQYFTAENGILFSKDKKAIYAYPSASGNYIIPSHVTSIGECSFSNTQISEVTIPSTVSKIGAYAFDECSSLTTVTVEATTPPTLDTSVFLSTTLTSIIVPNGTGDVYKTAAYWSDYADKIVEANA